jgi:hypothetical protein
MSDLRRWRTIAEALHSYDNPDWQTKFQPVKSGDTFRVFHGFRDFPHALAVAQHGLSGKDRADRAYSYEFDNNPHGLFITLSFKVAAEFVGGYDEQCIMEFVARLDELEPPVWPGGSYTVQGQMAQYFGHGAKGRRARKQRARDAEQETRQRMQGDNPDLEHVRQSEQQYLAALLTASREYQALFVGDLAAERIAAFHVRPKGSRYDASWERLSRAEFIERYRERKVERSTRVFGPAEAFDGDAFIERLSKRFTKHPNSREIEQSIANLYQSVMQAEKPTQAFLSLFGNYLWPRQYKPAFLWMRRRFGRETAER